MHSLLMIKGNTYGSVPIFGKSVIVKRGDTVQVANDAHAEVLLSDTYMDASNNEHHYFVESDSPEALAYFKKAGKQAPEKVTAKTKTAAKARRTRAAASEE